MKYYNDLLTLGCFTREELTAITGNYSTSGTVLNSYLQKGYVLQVKRNLYVAVNLADNEPIVSKFRIAGKITKSAYVSHHTAFEYYGCANQVSYQVETSSQKPFTSFIFNGNSYTYLASRINNGIITQSDGVRVTDIERTILDNIHDFEKIMGLEELLRCLALIPSVKEDKLLEYLAIYNKQVLYQKTGYILRYFMRELNLSESFFSECAMKIGKSTRYLTYRKSNIYDKEWQLMVPDNFMNLTTKGVEHNADL